MGKVIDMATGRPSPVIQILRRAALAQDAGGRTDGELPGGFVARRDGAALEALMRRHGPMVLGVCRRLLHDSQEVEDAFQASFLILARKAGGAQRQTLIGPWLYGVAYRVAARLRGRAARRRERVQSGVDLDGLPADAAACPDLQTVVHEEVGRLPDKYRSAVILCCFEGKTNEEAAVLLRRPVGTVKSRLARARELLRSRLTRRGMASTGGALTAALASHAATASVALVETTIHGAARFAAGDAAAAGQISARAVALTRGVLQTMWLTKMKIAAALVLAVLTVGGVGGWAWRAGAGETPAAPKVVAGDKPVSAEKPKEDGDAIQGVWRIASIVRGGKEQDDAQARYEKTQKYVITADRVVIRCEIEVNLDQGPRTTLNSEYTYDLDPTRTPKVLDMWPQYAPYKGKVLRGVYALEGDVLKICQDLGLDGERPKELASKEGDKTRLLALKREPGDKDKKEEKPKGDADAERIQGTWVAVSGENGGKKLTPSNLETFLLVITKEQLVFGPDFFRDLRASYKLDPTKTPKEIELTSLEGFAKWKAMKDIYRLDDDRLTLCIQYDDRYPAPTEFAMKADSGLWLFHLKRWPRDDVPKDLTAKIVAPAEVASTDPELKGEFVLTNKGDAPVRICTLCNDGNDGLGGPFAVHYRPDWWKSDRPTLEMSAKSVLALEPGKSYSFPFAIQRAQFQDRDTFPITAFYSVGREDFAKQLDLWFGKAEAAPVLVHVNRK